MKFRVLWAVLAAVIAAPAQAAKDDVFIAFAEPLVALTHVELIDGQGGPVQGDMTVVVKDGRIAAIGPSAELKVPNGAVARDLTGHTLAPGLVMLHEHIFYPMISGAYGTMFDSFPKLYLAGGATTIRTGGSMGGQTELNLKRDIDTGKAIGPDVDVTAPFLNGSTPFVLQMTRITSPEQARRQVAFWADEGTTSYKAYMHLDRAQLAAAIVEAHARKQKVTGHLCAVTYREAADLGIDNLEHGFFVASDFVADKVPDACPEKDGVQRALDALAVDDSRMRALQRHLIERKVAVTSTLAIFETFASGRPLVAEATTDVLITPLKEMYLQRWSAIAQRAVGVWTSLFPKGMAWEKQFFDAGGLLVAGSDPTGYGGVVPGFSNGRTLQLLVEAGFSAGQAVQVTSLNGARYLGRDAEIGSISVGKRADLMLLKGSASTDPASWARNVWTMKAGVAYDSAKIRAAYVGKVGLH